MATPNHPDGPTPRVLALIPARGGSKGVPGKNIKSLHGKPLLAYTADSALAAEGLSRVIVSTDDPAIADCARELGVDVPFLRPAELATDHCPTLPVMQHAVEACEATDGRYDAICLLQPTTPFRPPDLIDRCLTLLVERSADTVMTVEAVPHDFNPEWLFLRDGDTLRVATGRPRPIARRQELPRAFRRTGAVYVVRRETLMDQETLYGARVEGVETPFGSTVNIDTLEDWERAERALSEGLAQELGMSR